MMLRSGTASDAGGAVDDRLMYRREFFIGGRWEPPAGTERFGVISPSTEEVVGEVPVATDADADRAVDAARAAFDEGPWPRMAPAERADILARAAELLRKREPDIAAVTVDEMGCAVSQAPLAQTQVTRAASGRVALVDKVRQALGRFGR